MTGDNRVNVTSSSSQFTVWEPIIASYSFDSFASEVRRGRLSFENNSTSLFIPLKGISKLSGDNSDSKNFILSVWFLELTFSLMSSRNL